MPAMVHPAPQMAQLFRCNNREFGGSCKLAAPAEFHCRSLQSDAFYERVLKRQQNSVKRWAEVFAFLHPAQ
jgi:hypothetical protein